MRRALLLSFGGAFLGGFLLAACGADNLVAPPPPPPSSTAQCKGFDQLMPNFVKAISTGRTENLRVVVETQLMKPPQGRPNDPPPVNMVLRSIFMTIDTFAREPAEAGAPSGQLCAMVNPPPLTQVNDLCELRRSIDTLVHKGGGIDAINLLQPVLVGLLDYLAGTGTGKSATSHYEVANIFSGLCAQDANCQLSNGLDLAVGFADFANTPAGAKLFDDLNALVAKPSVNAFLDPTKFQEQTFVDLAKFFIPVINSADPAQLDALFNNPSLPLPASLKTDLAPVIDDLKVLLGHPEIMNPTKKSLLCVWGEGQPPPLDGGVGTGAWSGKDGNNFEILRMFHRLAIQDARPEFGVTRLMQMLTNLKGNDPRGSMLYVVRTLAAAVRRDEQGVDSSADVCRTLLTNTVQTGQVRTNAQLVVPVLNDLVKSGIVPEAICALDTLLYGCEGGDGGVRPACP